MSKLAELKPDQIDKTLTSSLDAKRIITLSKYIFKGFELLDKKDQGKINITVKVLSNVYI